METPPVVGQLDIEPVESAGLLSVPENRESYIAYQGTFYHENKKHRQTNTIVKGLVGTSY
jgi:hypothetical protein